MQYNDFISINFGVLYISTVLVALLARIAKDELLLLLTLQMYWNKQMEYWQSISLLTIYECNDVDAAIKSIFLCMNWSTFSKKVEDIHTCDFILHSYDLVSVIMLMIHSAILINASIYSCMINKDGLRTLKTSIAWSSTQPRNQNLWSPSIQASGSPKVAFRNATQEEYRHPPQTHGCVIVISRHCSLPGRSGHSCTSPCTCTMSPRG